MEQFTNLGDTIQSIYTLQLSEFAWVKRKSGDWTFSNLLEWAKNNLGEDVMIFSVNENGKERKSLRPRRWVKMVRKCSPHVRSEYFKSVMETIQCDRPLEKHESDVMLQTKDLSTCFAPHCDVTI